jgi:hypothetical protein
MCQRAISKQQLLPGAVFRPDSILFADGDLARARANGAIRIGERYLCIYPDRSSAGSATARLIFSNALARRAFAWPRVQKNLTGEIYEILPDDCGIHGADGRDSGLVEQQ